MTLEVPEKLAKIIRSEVEAWTAELVVLRRDPAVKKFLELQDRIDQTASGHPASYRFATPRNGGTDANRKRFGLPANELSGLKAEDLEDVIGLPRGELERS